MKKIRAGGKAYFLYSLTGNAVRADTEKIVVSGSGAGQSNNGKQTGFVPITVQRTAAVYDRLFLTDSNGRKHALQLAGFDLLCEEGNEMTAVWMVREKESRGPFVAVKNRSTGQWFFSDGLLREIFAPPVWWPLLFVFLASALALALKGGIVSLAVSSGSLPILLIMRYRQTKKRVRRFKTSLPANASF